jgi:hypothetical protein
MSLSSRFDRAISYCQSCHKGVLQVVKNDPSKVWCMKCNHVMSRWSEFGSVVGFGRPAHSLPLNPAGVVDTKPIEIKQSPRMAAPKETK